MVTLLAYTAELAEVDSIQQPGSRWDTDVRQGHTGQRDLTREQNVLSDSSDFLSC
jgi:hypothetical protein